MHSNSYSSHLAIALGLNLNKSIPNSACIFYSSNSRSLNSTKFNRLYRGMSKSKLKEPLLDSLGSKLWLSPSFRTFCSIFSCRKEKNHLRIINLIVIFPLNLEKILEASLLAPIWLLLWLQNRMFKANICKARLQVFRCQK